MWCLQMSIPCGHGGPYMERGSLDKAWALGILGPTWVCPTSALALARGSTRSEPHGVRRGRPHRGAAREMP